MDLSDTSSPRCAFVAALAQMSNEDKVRHVEQLLLDVMDIVEQSPEEGYVIDAHLALGMRHQRGKLADALTLERASTTAWRKRALVAERKLLAREVRACVEDCDGQALPGELRCTMCWRKGDER